MFCGCPARVRQNGIKFNYFGDYLSAEVIGIFSLQTLVQIRRIEKILKWRVVHGAWEMKR